MSREKRTAQIRANIFPSTKADLEQALAEEGNVISISDWLFETVAEKLEMRKAIRISKQKISRRYGQQ